MTVGKLAVLRREYHQKLFDTVLRLRGGKPNNADASSASSVAISRELVREVGLAVKEEALPPQRAGRNFEAQTRLFLRRSFEAVSHLRPGTWTFAVGGNIWGCADRTPDGNAPSRERNRCGTSRHPGRWQPVAGHQ